MHSPLKHIVNSFDREYFIEQANKPLTKAIVILAKRYPEPTYENLLHPNSKRLFGIKDKFFLCWDVRGGKPLYEALWRIVIVKYEHSPNWRNFLDWLFMMVQDNWKPWNPTRQMPLWKGNK